MQSTNHHELLFQITPQSYKSFKLPLKYITLQNQRKRKIDNYIIQDEIRQLEHYLNNQQKHLHLLKKQIKHHQSYINLDQSSQSNPNLNSNCSNTPKNIELSSFNNYFDPNDTLLITNQQFTTSELNLVSTHRGRKKKEEDDKSYGLFKKIQKSKMNIKSQIVFCFGVSNYLKHENNRWSRTDDLIQIIDQYPQKHNEQLQHDQKYKHKQLPQQSISEQQPIITQQNNKTTNKQQSKI